MAAQFVDGALKGSRAVFAVSDRTRCREALFLEAPQQLGPEDLRGPSPMANFAVTTKLLKRRDATARRPFVLYGRGGEKSCELRILWRVAELLVGLHSVFGEAEVDPDRLATEAAEPPRGAHAGEEGVGRCLGPLHAQGREHAAWKALEPGEDGRFVGEESTGPGRRDDGLRDVRVLGSTQQFSKEFGHAQIFNEGERRRESSPARVVRGDFAQQIDERPPSGVGDANQLRGGKRGLLQEEREHVRQVDGAQEDPTSVRPSEALQARMCEVDRCAPHVDGTRRTKDFNETSLVTLLELDGARVLFMGDAEAGGRALPKVPPTPRSIEGYLLRQRRELIDADVLIVGHHGSQSSSRRAFLDAVTPKVSVLSSGPMRYDDVTLPDAAIVSELAQVSALFRTDVDDAACAKNPKKIGPDSDGQPGGCDNVQIEIQAGKLKAGYARLAD